MFQSPGVLHRLKNYCQVPPTPHCIPSQTASRMPFPSSLRRHTLLLLRHRRLNIDHGSLSIVVIPPLLHLHPFQFANTGRHVRLSFSCGLQFGAFLVDHVVLAGLAHSVGDGGYGGEAQIEGCVCWWSWRVSFIIRICRVSNVQINNKPTSGVLMISLWQDRNKKENKQFDNI